MSIIYDSTNILGKIKIRFWSIYVSLTESTRSLLALKTLLVKYNHKAKKIVFADKNTPSPWYTYPFLDFIDSLDFSESSVFEYGSGFSTLYWAKNAKTVSSVESDRLWANKVSQIIQSGNTSNIDYHSIQNPDEYVNSINLEANKKYDIIIVDGIKRFDSAKASIGKLSPSGVIILDNSEWCPDTVDFLISEGYFHIPFSGFGPSNQFTWTTSLFFKSLDGPFFSEKAKARSLGMVKPSECDYIFIGEHS